MTPDSRVLVVGECNFTFSSTLIGLPGFSAGSVTSTTWSSQTSSPVGSHQVEELAKRGVSILYEVDAKQLHTHTDLAGNCFDDIIFTFPYSQERVPGQGFARTQ